MYSPLSSLNDSLYNTTRLLHSQLPRNLMYKIQEPRDIGPQNNENPTERGNLSPYIAANNNTRCHYPPKKGPRHRKILSCSYYRTPGLLSPLCFLFLVGRWHVCYSRASFSCSKSSNAVWMKLKSRLGSMVFRVTDLISDTNAVWVRELMDGVENVVIEWNMPMQVFFF